MRHSFLYLFSLVRISEFLYANFSFTCVRCTQKLSSSKASATADTFFWVLHFSCHASPKSIHSSLTVFGGFLQMKTSSWTARCSTGPNTSRRSLSWARTGSATGEILPWTTSRESRELSADVFDLRTSTGGHYFGVATDAHELTCLTGSHGQRLFPVGVVPFDNI